MFNYCGIDFVETASGLLAPNPVQTCHGGLHSFLRQAHDRGGELQTSGAAKELFAGMELDDDVYYTDSDGIRHPLVSPSTGRYGIGLQGYRPGKAYSWAFEADCYLSDFITDGPLSDTTVEDFLKC